MSTGGQLAVAIRVRPTLPLEVHAPTCVTISESSVVQLEEQNSKSGVFARRFRRREFSFDICFSPDSTQMELYDWVSERVLPPFTQLEEDCAVIAYGQSGTGKTHTMLGSIENPGLIPRLCGQLLNGDAVCQISFYEIYNEHVYDLMTSNGRPQRLKVRLHPQFGPYVQGLSRRQLESEQVVAAALAVGLRARSTEPTALHHSSSRSHAVFTVYRQARGDRSVRLHLVDLAGSEKTKQMATAVRMKESAFINKSLAALGNVILALSSKTSAGRRVFAPYRDSTLTWLLKDSLGGGSSCTLMIGTVSPSSRCYAESLKTLRYAHRARHIVSVREDRHDDGVGTTSLRTLRDEVRRLRRLLDTSATTQGSAACRCSAAVNSAAAIDAEALSYTSVRCIDCSTNRSTVTRSSMTSPNGANANFGVGENGLPVEREPDASRFEQPSTESDVMAESAPTNARLAGGQSKAPAANCSPIPGDVGAMARPSEMPLGVTDEDTLAIANDDATALDRPADEPRPPLADAGAALKTPSFITFHDALSSFAADQTLSLDDASQDRLTRSLYEMGSGSGDATIGYDWSRSFPETHLRRRKRLRLNVDSIADRLYPKKLSASERPKFAFMRKFDLLPSSADAKNMDTERAARCSPAQVSDSAGEAAAWAEKDEQPSSKEQTRGRAELRRSASQKAAPSSESCDDGQSPRGRLTSLPSIELSSSVDERRQSLAATMAAVERAHLLDHSMSNASSCTSTSSMDQDSVASDSPRKDSGFVAAALSAIGDALDGSSSDTSDSIPEQLPPPPPPRELDSADSLLSGSSIPDAAAPRTLDDSLGNQSGSPRFDASSFFDVCYESDDVSTATVSAHGEPQPTSPSRIAHRRTSEIHDSAAAVDGSTPQASVDDDTSSIATLSMSAHASDSPSRRATVYALDMNPEAPASDSTDWTHLSNYDEPIVITAADLATDSMELSSLSLDSASETFDVHVNDSLANIAEVDASDDDLSETPEPMPISPVAVTVTSYDEMVLSPDEEKETEQLPGSESGQSENDAGTVEHGTADQVNADGNRNRHQAFQGLYGILMQCESAMGGLQEDEILNVTLIDGVPYVTMQPKLAKVEEIGDDDDQANLDPAATLLTAEHVASLSASVGDTDKEAEDEDTAESTKVGHQRNNSYELAQQEEFDSDTMAAGGGRPATEAPSADHYRAQFISALTFSDDQTKAADSLSSGQYDGDVSDDYADLDATEMSGSPRKVSWGDAHGRPLELGPSLTLGNGDSPLRPIIRLAAPESDADLGTSTRSVGVNAGAQTDSPPPLHSSLVQTGDVGSEEESSPGSTASLGAVERHAVRRLFHDLKLLVTERDRVQLLLARTPGAELGRLRGVSADSRQKQMALREQLVSSKSALDGRVDAVWSALTGRSLGALHFDERRWVYGVAASSELTFHVATPRPVDFLEPTPRLDMQPERVEECLALQYRRKLALLRRAIVDTCSGGAPLSKGAEERLLRTAQWVDAQPIASHDHLHRLIGECDQMRDRIGFANLLSGSSII